MTSFRLRTSSLLLFSIICCSTSAYAEEKASKVTPLSSKDLKIASQTLTGYWEEEDAISNDTLLWSGSTLVYGKNKGKLFLITNKHCLYLLALKQADLSGDIEVKSYNLVITFPTGIDRKVEHFYPSANDLDIALLVIDAAGLTEGVDYVTLRALASPQIKEGSQVVAVGTPEDLIGTQTHGRISALRSKNPRFIQIDAALNHGNSGGPLFWKRADDAYFWIGVNTAAITEANNIGFAIDARDVFNLGKKPKWYKCNALGAAQATSNLK